MLGRALAPVSLHPQQNGCVNLEMVYCLFSSAVLLTVAVVIAKAIHDGNGNDNITK